ncbi:MAG: DUF456 domain-containing protein [Balneolaceae bacterium]
MDIIWIIIGAVFIIAGIIGSVIPVMPGTPLSYVGLLFLQLTQTPPFSLTFMLVWALIVVVVSSLDNLASIVGAQRMGGTRYGIFGCLIGGILGLFIFPPFGLILGPIAGAFLGELFGGKNRDQAMKAATGAVLGFFVSTFIKLIVSLILAYYFIVNV